MKRGLLLLLLVVCFPANAWRINISSGTPRMGLGDIASNVWMAHLLSLELPGSEFRLIVEPRILSHIQVLLPTLERHKRPQRVPELPRLTFYVAERDDKLPEADFAMIFAYDDMRHKPLDSLVVYKTAPIIIRCPEFDWSQMSMLDDEPRAKVSRSGEKLLIDVPTGPKAWGMYYLPDPPAAPYPQARAEEIINETLVAQGEPRITLRGAPTGFSYTLARQSTQFYLSITRELARHEGYGNQLLFVNDFVARAPGTRAARDPGEPGLDITGIPEGVRAVRLKQLSFPLSISINAGLGLAAYNTGDVSISIGLQYGHIPLYERKYWKDRFVKNLVDAVEAIEPNLWAGAPVHWDRLLSLEMNDQILAHPPVPAADIARTLANPKYPLEFRRMTHRLRRRTSLPLNIVALLFLLAEKNARQAEAETYRADLQAIPARVAETHDTCGARATDFE